MKTYFYLCLTPEALVASHLNPTEFGQYMAIGSRRQVSGPALFFTLDDSAWEAFGADAAVVCQPHEDGNPRRSAYLAIYRVLERIPWDALGRLHLVTRNGFVLPLEQAPLPEKTDETYFLYQEITPVSPRIVSRLNPVDFAGALTEPTSQIHVPRIVFADMQLGVLATDPNSKNLDKLPYANLKHLGNCLQNLVDRPNKKTKIVNRDTFFGDLYYMMRSGVYVAGAEGCLFYPIPDEDTLTRDHRTWWSDARGNPRF